MKKMKGALKTYLYIHSVLSVISAKLLYFNHLCVLVNPEGAICLFSFLKACAEKVSWPYGAF